MTEEEARLVLRGKLEQFAFTSKKDERRVRRTFCERVPSSRMRSQQNSAAPPPPPPTAPAPPGLIPKPILNAQGQVTQISLADEIRAPRRRLNPVVRRYSPLACTRTRSHTLTQHSHNTRTHYSHTLAQYQHSLHPLTRIQRPQRSHPLLSHALAHSSLKTLEHSHTRLHSHYTNTHTLTRSFTLTRTHSFFCNNRIEIDVRRYRIPNRMTYQTSSRGHSSKGVTASARPRTRKKALRAPMTNGRMTTTSFLIRGMK